MSWMDKEVSTRTAERVMLGLMTLCGVVMIALLIVMPDWWKLTALAPLLLGGLALIGANFLALAEQPVVSIRSCRYLHLS